MSRRTELYMLGGLLILLVGLLYFMNRAPSSDASGVVAADGKFQPLEVHEPELRLDLLAKLQTLEYSGTHRNIFIATPPPPPTPPGQQANQQPARQVVGPMPPPPPPPLQIPAELFGYESMPKSGKRVAFFTSGDDVLVVPEGDTFLNRFRLVRIGNDSADVEETSSGRHASVQMVQPPPENQ
jgi:hypothetical protein